MATNQGPVVIQELLNALTPNERWQINWLGDIRKHGPQYAQHMVDAFFSPVHPNSAGGQLCPGATDVTRQQVIPLGVGYLPILHIGATFRAGKPIHLPPNLAFRRRLSILPGDATFFTLDSAVDRFFPINEERKAVMLSEFDTGPRAWQQAKGSQILAMPDINRIDPYYVMISSLEVARFFFCHTSFFARSLFAHGWEDLLRREYCKDSNLPLSVTVAHKTVLGLSRTNATHLGLLLASKRTQEVVSSIHQTFQSPNKSTSVGAPLHCRFPFDTATQIEAEVIRIRTGTRLKERFFVTRLLKCERPIPFDICFVNPALHPGQGSNRDAPDLGSITIGGKQTEELPPDGAGTGARPQVFSNTDEMLREGALGDQDGAPAKCGGGVEIEAPEDRFPGLASVPTPLAPKDKQSYRYLPGGAVLPKKGAHLSTATPAGSRPIVPANIATDPPSASDDPTIKLLLESVPYLRDVGYLVTELAPCFLAAYERKSSRSRSWAKIEKGLNLETGQPKYRSRILAAIQIELANMYCIVAEIERRIGDQFGLAAFYMDQSVDADGFLDTVGYQVVASSGWPPFDAEKRVFLFANELQIPGSKGHHQRNMTDGEQTAIKIANCFLNGSNVGGQTKGAAI